MGRLREALQVLLGKKPEGQVVAQLIPTWMAARPIATKINYAAYVYEGYLGSPVVFSCIREIVGSASEPTWIMDRGDETDPIRKHEILALLKRPNVEQDGVTFIASGLTHAHIWGDWYIHKVRSRGGRVVQLWNLRPDRVEIKRDLRGNIEWYAYYVPGSDAVGSKIGPPIPIPAEDVIHYKWEENPADDNYGLSPLTVLARLIDLDASSIDYLRAFFSNQGIPAGLIKLQNRVQKEERDRIKTMFREEYSGLRSSGGTGQGWHGVMVMDASVEYEQIAAPTEKLRLQPVFDVIEARICSVFNVPPILVGVMVGLEHMTYSNYKEARASLWEETLAPIYRKLGDAFTNGLCHEFGLSEDYRVRPDLAQVLALQDDKQMISGMVVSEWRAGLRTLNEARAAVGLKEIDDEEKGESFYGELNKPASAFGQPGEESDQPQGALPPGKTQRALPPKKKASDDQEEEDTEGETRPGRRPPPSERARQQREALAAARRDQTWSQFIQQADPLELAMTRDVALIIGNAAQEALTEVRRQSIPAATISTVPTPESVQQALVKLGEQYHPKIAEAGWNFGAGLVMSGGVGRHAVQPLVWLVLAFDILYPGIADFVQERPWSYAAFAAETIIDEIRDIILEGIHEGHSIDRIANKLEDYARVGGAVRARTIARTEVINGMNKGAVEAYKKSGVVPRKSWLTARDDRVRGTKPYDRFDHVAAEGQTVPVGSHFVVTGEHLQYPGDPEGSPGNIINCRCTVVPVMDEQQSWDPSQHPHKPAGTPEGGQWAPKSGSGLVGLIEELGGFTISMADGNMPKAGFAVSPYRGREKTLKASEVSAPVIAEYVAANWDVLSQKDHYLGAWRDPRDGTVYLDVSVLVQTAQQAEDLALRHDQLAYYDLAKGETVNVQGQRK